VEEGADAGVANRGGEKSAVHTRADREGCPAAAGEMDHSTMDHSQMDHSMMDHGAMGHGDHAMTFDAEGMVMNSNDTRLPEDCEAISREYQFEVRAGTRYAEPYAGTVFGMSQHEFEVAPCSRIKFTFINEDAIRHQFMIHNLPRYIYPQGMFHLEAAGGATKTGTLIVPSDRKTYLVHCDIAQHMEKGMKGQLKVGGGSADLTSIPGVTASFRPDNYLSRRDQLMAIGLGGVLVITGLIAWRRLG
jgi:FtsP/CotA-like multicopper oxidase with cupredoxin domain